MIILNEREYAEKCLSTYSYGDNIYETLQILAKYYYSDGLRVKRIEKKLLEFLQSNYPRYSSNILKWQDTVEKISRRAGKYPLYENAEVMITKAELDTIAGIEEKKGKPVLRRLAFTMLCLAKLANQRNEKNNGWVNTSVKEIFDMAHISATNERKYQLLGDLGIIGLIEFPKKNDNLSNRVTFVNDDSPYVLTISDFRELGYEYLLYCGDNYVRCANCGRLFKGVKNGSKKYCNDCTGYLTYPQKTLICLDCGCTFETKMSNTRTIRCESCQRIHRNKYQRELMRNR